jgi:hypothetical protein
MENKVLLVTTLISAIGLLFVPAIKRESEKPETPKYLIEAETYLNELKSENRERVDSIKNVIDSLKSKPKQQSKIKYVNTKEIVHDTIFVYPDSIK